MALNRNVFVVLGAGSALALWLLTMTGAIASEPQPTQPVQPSIIRGSGRVKVICFDVNRAGQCDRGGKEVTRGR